LLVAAPEATQERLLGALGKLKKSERLVLSGLLSKLVELAEVSSLGKAAVGSPAK
jgi:hypothetical protein